MDTFDTIEQENAPWWLRGNWGQRWFAAWGLVKEAILQALIEALKVKYPKHAPDDALPYIGAERGIRKTPIEPLSRFRNRLENSREISIRRGTRRGMREALESDGFTVEIYDNTEKVFDANSGDIANYWARFLVIVREPHGIKPPTKCGATEAVCGAFVCGMSGSVDEMRSACISVGENTPPMVQPLGVVFEVDGPICGAVGTVCGSMVCGGNSVLITAWE